MDYCERSHCRKEAAISYLGKLLCSDCWHEMCDKDEATEAARAKMPLVIIDASYVGYIAAHSLEDLSFNDRKTGIVFGFFDRMLRICTDKRIMSNQVVVCFDSAMSIRRRSYPEYKRNRRQRSPEDIRRRIEIRQQLAFLRRRILPDIGVQAFRQPGLESDDVMAQAAKQCFLSGRRAVMITADSDLYQCITALTHWFDPVRDVYHDPTSLLNKTHISPGDWRRLKTIAGCRVDNVSGIPGVGVETAKNYIWKLLKPTSQRMHRILSEEGRSVCKRNDGLVGLPHVATKEMRLNVCVPKREAFWKWARRLGFASFVRNANRWDAFFDGVFDRQHARARRPGE